MAPRPTTRTSRTRTLAGVAGALALVLAACSDGNPLRPPAAETPVTIVEPDAVSLLTPGAGFTIASPAFVDRGEIPSVHSGRDGDDLSPPLVWQEPPEGTVELALVVTDPNADGFVHWVMWGLDPTSRGVDLGQVPPGAVQATNDFGNIGYGGPAPPESESHAYVFQLFALGRSAFDVAEGIDGRSAITEMENRAVGVTEIVAFYG